jgi:hypothetical protein
MCFGNIKYYIAWIREYNIFFTEHYSNPANPHNIIIKPKNKHEVVMLAYMKGLSKLHFSEDDIEKYIKFLKKISEINKLYIQETGRMICANPYFFIYMCFPEKNIIQTYYPISKNKKKKYDDIEKFINKFL